MLVCNMQKAVFNRALSLDIFEHEKIWLSHIFNNVQHPFIQQSFASIWSVWNARDAEFKSALPSDEFTVW